MSREVLWPRTCLPLVGPLHSLLRSAEPVEMGTGVREAGITYTALSLGEAQENPTHLPPAPCVDSANLVEGRTNSDSCPACRPVQTATGRKMAGPSCREEENSSELFGAVTSSFMPTA